MVQIFPIRSIFSNQVPKAKSISSHQNDDNADTVVPYLPTIVIPRNLVEPIDDNLQNLNSSFIIYSQTVGFHTQTGICAALSIDNYSNGVLKRHENTVNGFELCFHAKEFTLPSPSSSSSSCRTQSNNLKCDPIMVMYRDSAALQVIIDRVISSERPVQVSIRRNGDVHKMWRVSPEDCLTIQTAFEDVDSLYIADGHHRTAAAHRLAQSETDPTKKSYWQSRFLVGLLFPHSQLRVLSFGRCLRSLGTLTTDKFLRQVAKSFIIKLRTDLIEPGSPTSVSSGSLSDSTSCESSSSLSPTVSVSTDYLFSESHDSILSFPSENVSSENQLSSLTFKPLLPVFNLNMHLEKNAIKYEPYHSRNINMYIDGRWFELTPKQMPRSHAGPLDELGVQILIDKLLDPILGPEDHDADSRMEYICGDRSDGRALAQMVDCGDVSVAFCVCRIEIADIMKVADAGQLLPPKATCFDPKPCSGLFLRLS